MKNYKQAWIDFMWWKNEVIKEVAGVEYFTKEDEKALLQFPEKMFQIISIKLSARNDTRICPFCLIHGNRCGNCVYKFTHGKCGVDKNNTYEKICHQARTFNIINIICNKHNKKFGRWIKAIKKGETLD